MELELLVVGIARGDEKDYTEYYRRTSAGAFACALALTGDRILAREAAAESYRRVVSEAKVFDTSMSAVIWHFEMLRNLCLNGLADGEIARQAEFKRRENLSRFITACLFETADERGRIIALRGLAGLSPGETSKILRYNSLSARGEYRRGIGEAAKICGFTGGDKKSFGELENMLKEDLAAAVPDFFELSKGGRATAFSNINCSMLLVSEKEKALPGETREERQDRIARETLSSKKRAVIISAAIIGAVLAAAAIVLVWYFANHRRPAAVEGGETQPNPEAQYRTKAECAVIGDRIFYSDYSDKGALYVWYVSSGAKRKISDAVPRDFSEPAGDVCYFRNASTGELCSLNSISLEVKTVEALVYGEAAEDDLGGMETPEPYLTTVKGALPCVRGDDLFFSSASGVSKISGGAVENIYVDYSGSRFRYDMAFAGDSLVFSAAPTDGLYRLTLNDAGEYFIDETLDGYVIYGFCVSGSHVMFDDGNGSLFAVDVVDTNGSIVKAELLSSAFCFDGDTAYFYGKTENGPRGVYSISLSSLKAGDVPELVFSCENDLYDISDIYVSEGLMLLYYSNGEKTGSYNELVLRKTNGETHTLFRVSK